MGYSLLINGIYWGYNSLTNLLHPFTNFLGHPSREGYECTIFLRFFAEDSLRAQHNVKVLAQQSEA